MAFILRLFVLLPLLLAVACLIYAFSQRPWSINNFREERIIYTSVYIDIYGISRRYRNIEIISDSKKHYSLFPEEGFIPSGMTLENIVELLRRSSEATVWMQRDNDLNILRGIETEYFSIPPTRSLVKQKSERTWLFCFAVGCFVFAVISYISFKRSYNLNWKLGFKLN